MTGILAGKFLATELSIEDFEQGKRLVLHKRFTVAEGGPYPFAITGTPFDRERILQDPKSKIVNYKIDMMPAGPLSLLIEASTKENIEGYTLATKFAIAYAIALQVKNLHKRKFLHIDLTPGNILVDETFYPVVLDPEALDFNRCGRDLTRTWEREAEAINNWEYMTHDFWYRPPEMLNLEGFQEFTSIRQKEKPDDYFNRMTAVNAFMFGMILYELFTGIVPMSDQGIFDDTEKLLDQSQIGPVLTFNDPNIPSTMNCPVQDLISACVGCAPCRRPKFDEILGDLTNAASAVLGDDDMVKMDEAMERTNKPDESNIHGTIENLVKCARRGIPWSKEICQQFEIKIE